MRLIDADALKELKFPNGESEYVTGWNDAISAIMTFQPTIDAEPVRHGGWVSQTLISTSNGTYMMHKCSECGDMTINRYKYCPNCGARMDEDDR